MFIPAEAVFAEIQAHHVDLVDKAHAARVWMVSPTTLWATLNTARAVLKDAATKEQVQHMIVSLLQLDGAPAEDAADALAAAICHAHRRRIEGQLGDDVVLANLR